MKNRIECNYCDLNLDTRNILINQINLNNLIKKEKNKINKFIPRCNCEISEIKKSTSTNIICKSKLTAIEIENTRVEIKSIKELESKITGKEIEFIFCKYRENNNKNEYEIKIPLNHHNTKSSKHFKSKIYKVNKKHEKSKLNSKDLNVNIEINININGDHQIINVDLLFDKKLRCNYKVEPFKKIIDEYHRLNPDSNYISATYMYKNRFFLKAGATNTSIGDRVNNFSYKPNMKNYHVYPTQKDFASKIFTKVYVKTFDDPVSPFIFEKYLSKTLKEINVLGNFHYDNCGGYFDKDKSVYHHDDDITIREYKINVFIHRDENLNRNIYIEINKDFYTKYFLDHHQNNIEHSTLENNYLSIDDYLLEKKFKTSNDTTDFFGLLINNPISGTDRLKIENKKSEKISKLKQILLFILILFALVAPIVALVFHNGIKILSPSDI